MDRKIIYQLTVDDVQNVAMNELERELNTEEIKVVEDKIGNYIDWYSAVDLVINSELVNRKIINEQQTKNHRNIRKS